MAGGEELAEPDEDEVRGHGLLDPQEEGEREEQRELLLRENEPGDEHLQKGPCESTICLWPTLSERGMKSAEPAK